MVQLINAKTPLEEARTALSEQFDLRFSKTVADATAPIFERVRRRIPEIEWPFFAPLIFHINRLKQEKDALILAHAYQTPQICFGVADIAGDNISVAMQAARTRKSIIVQCGVLFSAETSKLLNPDATVLIPDSRAGCSLAASITPEDVLALRAQFPGVPVVAHVNTTAAVKAQSDVCCTALNALDIIEALPGDSAILVPDQYLAQNLAARTRKKLITWAGSCELHQGFSAAHVGELRRGFPQARIVAHLQCTREVTALADFSGSTAQMIDWVRAQKPAQVALLTDASVSDNLAAETAGTDFVRGNAVCPHMKRINLENILWALHSGTEEVTLAPEISAPARQALERMIAMSTEPALA